MPAVTAALSFLVFVSLIPRAFVYGDAPAYTRQMLDGDLWVETIHVGYAIIGYLFTMAVPGDPVYAVNLMSAIFGALCVGLVTSIAQKLAGHLAGGVAAALSLLCVREFVFHSVFAELYIVQLFFFLLSVLLTLSDKPVASGLAFAWAFLVTPSTILALPLFLFWRPERRFLVRWVAAAAALIVAIVAPNVRDYLWGYRGLLNMSAADLTMPAAIEKEWLELGGWRFLVVGAFSVVGLTAMARSAEHRPFAAGIASLWVLGFFLGERYQDVPVQLPFYSMLAVASGFGFAYLLRAWKGRRALQGAALLVLVAGVALSLGTLLPHVAQQSRFAEALREDIRAMADEMQPDDVAVYVWPGAPIAQYELDSAPSAWIDYALLSGLGGESQYQQSWGDLEAAIANRRRVWLVLTPAPAIEYLEGRGYQLAHAAGGTVSVALFDE